MVVQKLIDRVFGSKNDRALKKIRPIVEAVGALDARHVAMSDEEIKGRTAEFRRRIEAGEPPDAMVAEVFATVREASRRVLNMRHFDVQLIGGLALHQGHIAEMRTGEGKTLVATAPAYLNALSGRGVHVVTVNDYLARRDAEWMGGLYRWLGLSVGVIQHDMPTPDRRAAYAADITYGTNNEFGFDYLRDNMKYSAADYVQRGHAYAIVDEVDSILIDEARTPLIISGPAEEATNKYLVADDIVRRLRKDIDYKVNEEAHTANLTEEGIEKIEKLLGVTNIYDPQHIEMLHCVQQALRAISLYRRDRDYMIQEGQVVIVDEFTGRLMPGRRWSDGLHQAVEAKEKVKIQRENQTLATVTLQNYFRMYSKLAGMTGTAVTEETEFRQIYGLDVVVIPTNRAMRRIENPDVVFRTAGEKWHALVEDIVGEHEKGRPVLVGTTSIENSEMVSSRLARRGIKHVVLNAKYHEREALIVAQAGRKGTVTVATNMAGRGTDILLGGNPEFDAGPLLEAAHLSRYEGEGAEYLRRILRDDLEGARQIGARHEALTEEVLQRIVKIRDRCKQEHDDVVAAGGLHVVGTERHEARRIDNQLRGRSGRQGDPGSSRFYLSLEDDLMRIFASERVSELMKRLGMDEGVPIEHPWVTRAIENAQGKVEANNYGIRKHLLEYDDVMNQQRKEIYSLRYELLTTADPAAYVGRVAFEVADGVCDEAVPEKAAREAWDVDGLVSKLRLLFGIQVSATDLAPAEADEEGLRERVRGLVQARWDDKRARLGDELFQMHCRFMALRSLDDQWKDHLLSLDHLKEGIGLRGYGQRDPKMEYKRESFDLFADMKSRYEDEMTRYAFLVEPVTQAQREDEERKARERLRRLEEISAQTMAGSSTGVRTGAAVAAATPAQAAAAAPPRTERAAAEDRIGRNDPCPCGSGKKYKKCCAQSAV